MIEMVCSICGVAATLVHRMTCDGCGKQIQAGEATVINVTPGDAMKMGTQYQYHPECVPRLTRKK